MRPLIVGTAGHIDHGKSALVRALTGTDPDRLKEEQERGITIDLGFAHASLPDGSVVSFIDVPGHERFVRNMLAGAHGIDAVALVVAADESVMPQTREHFQICRLLGIRAGLIALTKCDLADPETLALAELEARELVAGSFLEDAAVVRVSARTGQGLEELRAELARLSGRARPRPAAGLPRLPVDRAFTLRGFGTVVTGTLVSGSLAPGDELAVLPSGRRARVRGLQVHGQPADRVEAGNRTAVNLAGVEVGDLPRGCVLSRPGTLRASTMLDVELALLPGGRALADGGRVRVHAASAEVLARVRLLEAPRLEPGRSGLAQLRLEQPAVAVLGDRLVLRSYSPATTIGGALVLDPLPPKRRRGATLEMLRALRSAEPGAAARTLVGEAAARGVELSELAARVGVGTADLLGALEADREVAILGKDPAWAVSVSALRVLGEAALAEVERHHRDNPLLSAVPREQLRGRVFAKAPAGALERVLDWLSAEGKLRLGPDTVALARHAVTLTPEEASAREALVQAARAAGLSGVAAAELARASGRDPRLMERVGRLLVSEGRLRRVGESQLLDAERLAALKSEVLRRWPPGSRIDVAAFKEMAGLSRKYVIPLLEYLDRERVTRRSGNDRLVLSPPA